VLLYATLISIPNGPPTGVDHSAGDARLSCEDEVSRRLGEVNFPFDPDVRYLNGGTYHLAGIADAKLAQETVRRNYECTVQFVGDDEYRVDSLRVWQSH